MGDAPTQTTTQTPTLDPELKAALMKNIGTAGAITGGILPQQVTGADGTTSWQNADGTPYTPPSSLVAGFTPDQQASFDKIRGIANNPLTSSQLGGGTYANLSNFQAPTINPTEANGGLIPNYAGITGQTVASVAPMTSGQVSPVGNVASNDVTSYDLSKYTNPGIANVIDPLTSYFNTQSDRAASAANGQAIAAGAARGSNPAIAQALAREGIASQAGAAIAPLLQSNYQFGMTQAQSDADRALKAAQGNQGAALTAATTQAGLDQGANAANLDVLAKNAMANAQSQQTADLSNVDQRMKTGLANQSTLQQAGIANQQGAIQGAGIQSAGAAGIAGANTGAQNSAIQGAGLINSSGNQQQGQQQALIDQILKALGINQSAVTSGIAPMTGSTTTQTGGGAGAAGILGGLGSLASGIGALGGTGGLATLLPMLSSKEYKTNKRPAETVLDKIATLPVERWTYRPEIGDGGDHVGPYAEDWAERFGGNGKSIQIIDFLGVLMKGVQELVQEVRALKAAQTVEA